MKRNIDLNENIENDILVKADPVSINRIINNLIENAIKFSDDNCAIEISLQCIGKKIFFSVKDCGYGIHPEMHKKIFEPYYQITNHKRSIQGMGLGLPIIKKVIQDLNGEIQIVSNPQKEPGTLMEVILAKYEKNENEIVAERPASKNIITNYEELNFSEDIHHINKQTILIVDDNISMVNYLFKKLKEKYNVYVALNGNEALQKIKNLKVLPDLILSDVMMDKIDGYTFAKIILKDPTYNHIPIIFLSAKSAKNDKFDGLKLGAIDFIKKPFIISELLQKIESILLNMYNQKQSLLTSAVRHLHTHENIITNNNNDIFSQNCDLYKLTSREKDITKLICEGHAYKIIGNTLFISDRTVTKHVQNIFEKLGVSNKIELINKLQT
jgi:DNA-binding NarL/FixJ family response regulator